ncbi:MAG TPA: hypothetical protein VKI62_09975, partial [Bacteroidota bacterium]|nr:hypothetical protein [Bacteroidota bacterium]
MGLKLKTRYKPQKKDKNIFSEQYYFARKLYFQYKLVPAKGKIIHAYKSQGIAEMLSKEFNVCVPDSTIRRWAVIPDKDFGGRTWLQEWRYRIDKGMLHSVSSNGNNEHLPESLSSLENKGLTPLESLTEMSRRSILNDIKMVQIFEIVFNNI